MQAHQGDVVWMLGKISQGMVDAEGHANTYSQLSAIQLGMLMDANAITWEDHPAANGQDTGCFLVHTERLPKAIEAMTSVVFGIKVRGDRAAAVALRANHIDRKEGSHFEAIETRLQRHPTPSYVYALRGMAADE